MIYKVITCKECGQIGMPLVNKGTRREKRYVCKNPEICNRRKNIGKLGGVLCSEWYCPESATASCSCGAKLCKFHKRLPTHFGHLKIGLEK